MSISPTLNKLNHNTEVYYSVHHKEQFTTCIRPKQPTIIAVGSLGVNLNLSQTSHKSFLIVRLSFKSEKPTPVLPRLLIVVFIYFHLYQNAFPEYKKEVTEYITLNCVRKRRR